MSRFFVLLRAVVIGFVPVSITQSMWNISGQSWTLHNTDAMYWGLGIVCVLVGIVVTPRAWRLHRALSGMALYLTSAVLVCCAGSAFFRSAWATMAQFPTDWESINELSSWLPQFMALLATSISLVTSLIVLHRLALFAEVQLGSIDSKSVELPQITDPLCDIEEAAVEHCRWAQFRQELINSMLNAMAPSSRESGRLFDNTTHRSVDVSAWYDDEWMSAGPNYSYDLHSSMDVNPASGLPMIEDSGIDVMGNPYGFDDH